jgi:hypothetical protein
MGGLTVATVLTLVVVPVIYAALEILAEKVKAKRRAKLRAKEKSLAVEES